MYYDSSDIHNKVKQAYGGDQAARKRLEGIQAIHACSPDYAVMVVVQAKHAVEQNDGTWRILNTSPSPDGQSYICADIYQCSANGSSSWTHIPIPRSFNVAELVYNEGQFTFVSETAQKVSGTAAQMGRAMRELDLIVQGASEEEIETAFLHIPDTVIAPRPVPKTVADNPSIEVATLGILEFDERLQWFRGAMQIEDYQVNLTLDVDAREAALALLPYAEQMINRLTALDLEARQYAAQELLELKNDFWVDEDEGEEELTAEQFANQMTLTTLSLDEDRGLVLWYDDGDLFAGHSITVDYDPVQGFISAEMAG